MKFVTKTREARIYAVYRGWIKKFKSLSRYAYKPRKIKVSFGFTGLFFVT